MTRWITALALLGACQAGKPTAPADSAVDDVVDTGETTGDTSDTGLRDTADSGTFDTADTDTSIDTDASDSDSADTDLSLDTDVSDSGTHDADTSDSDVADTDVIDTDVTDPDPPDPLRFVIPPLAETGDRPNCNTLGIYTRAQILSEGSLFPARPMTIHELRFRRGVDEPRASTPFTSPRFDLWLGTASRPRSAMSGTFADNLSGDEIRVFSGVAEVEAQGPDPLAYGAWVVHVSPPFEYNPSEGALVLDFRAPSFTGSWADPASFAWLDCRNDGSNYMKMTDSRTDVTVANNASGCGYSFQVVAE